MTWVLHNIVTNPDVYTQCQAEIDSILKENKEITANTVSLLTYTEAVIKETLRYHQPAPVLLRTAIADNTIVASDGKQIHIEKGTDIIINLNIMHRYLETNKTRFVKSFLLCLKMHQHILTIFSIHSSEKYWNEPQKFNPSRFLEHHSDVMYPFGLGQRLCIGQNFAMLESKIMIAILLHHFRFELVPGQKIVPSTAGTIRSVHFST